MMMKGRIAASLLLAAACVFLSASARSSFLDLVMEKIKSPSFPGNEEYVIRRHEYTVFEDARETALFSSSIVDFLLFDEFDATSNLDWKLTKRVSLRNGSASTAQILPSDIKGGLPFVHDMFLREGYSLVINGLDAAWPSVGAAATTMSLLLPNYYVKVNAYLTPPGTQAFATHYDYMDSFVLQLEGSKSWEIFENMMVYPLQWKMISSDRLRQNVTLHAGDVLFVPAGTPHRCLASTNLAKPSLHLTFGIERILESSVFRVLSRIIDTCVLGDDEASRLKEFVLDHTMHVKELRMPLSGAAFSCTVAIRHLESACLSKCDALIEKLLSCREMCDEAVEHQDVETAVLKQSHDNLRRRRQEAFQASFDKKAKSWDDARREL